MDANVLQHYAAMGLRLHPLKEHGKTPQIKGWADLATTDLGIIDGWNSKYPGANWGAVTGPESKITVVDIDPRNGGDTAWAALIAKNGEPNAPKVKTAGGGLHYYFKYFMGTAVIGRGIDILSSRHNVVLPPSITNDGAYEWMAGLPKHFPVAPPWLRELVKQKSGNRNEEAFRIACTRFRGGATQTEVLSEVLTEFGDESDAEHNAGLEKTVSSAYQRVLAPRLAFVNYNGNDPEDFDNFLGSDYGNAQLLVKYVGEDVLHVKDVGWVVYREGCWQFDDNLLYNRFTKIMNTQREHYAEAAGRATDKAVEKDLRLREQHFTVSTNNRTIKNGIELAATMQGFNAEMHSFDNGVTAHLLNFKNGTVDLRDGVMHPHSREHFITKMCPHPYEPDAEAPFWLETINKIFDGNDEMISYVQMMLGASLMGSQDARMLFIAYGRLGKNGKSTIFETLADVLGDYADHAELKMLASTDSGNLTELTTRMRIRGARFVFSSEVTSSDQMDASVIKRLTGGDTVSARAMFKGTITFRPTCSIWLRTNRLPNIKGADSAFWDRLCIIPFDHQFVGTEAMDMSYVMDRLKAEAPGILAWLVRGAVMWNTRATPYAVPKRVQELRDTYMTDSDVFGDFLSDIMKQEPGAEAKLSVVHRAYSDFCKRRGTPAPSISVFKQDMRGAGLLSADGKVIKGYTLSQDFDTFEM